MVTAASEKGGKTPAAQAEGFQSEYYRRLRKIQDRKLAVISMDKKPYMSMKKPLKASSSLWRTLLSM